MGLFGRLRSNWRGGAGGGEPSLIQEAGRDSPKIEEIKQAAAEDVARIEQDDKYFDPDSPANEDAE